MLKRTILTLTLALACIGLSSTAQADSFDDAVNLYLKGFDHCTEAKDALSSGDPAKASAALKRYNALKNQAEGINNTILTTNKRGMDSNLKFCERVATDIEIEIGTPILDKAIKACDQASADLKADNPEQARINYDEFVKLSNEAISTSPRLNDLFSTRNQIRRCERLDKKIAGFSKKQEALTLAIETVVEESEAYSSLCGAALKSLNTSELSDRAISNAQDAMSSARSRHSAVMAETLALAELEKTPNSPEKKSVDKNLASGDQCMTALNGAIQSKSSELKLAQQELEEYGNALSKANSQCQAVQKNAIAGATKPTYDQAKTQFDSAIKTRNDVRAALSRNNYYKDNSDWSSSRTISKNMSTLNTCLDKSRTHLGALFGALPTSAPPVASISKQIESNNVTAGVPAKKISGSIKMLNATPQFVIFYMLDGTRPEQNLEISIDASGFDQPVYFVGSGDTFRIKSKDFATHRITANNSNLNLSANLARVQSRQTRNAKVSWPENTLVELRSDRGSIVPSHIANIPSSNYKVIMFDFGADNLTFELDNPNEAAAGYLLIPDFDPLEIKLTQGEIKSLAITRNNEPLGSVLIKGM